MDGVVELSSAAGLAVATTLVLLAIVPGLGMPVFFVAADGATAAPLGADLGTAVGGSSATFGGAPFLGVPLAPALSQNI